MSYDILKDFIYTEKSNKELSNGKYYFKVDKNCNKNELKTVIKSLFGVDAEKINISNVSGKKKRFKGVLGQRKSYKRAVITLKEGQSINVQNLK